MDIAEIMTEVPGPKIFDSRGLHYLPPVAKSSLHRGMLKSKKNGSKQTRK